MNLKTIKFYALCLNTNVYVCLLFILCFLVLKKPHREYIFDLFLLYCMKKMVDSSGLSEPGARGWGSWPTRFWQIS